MRVLLVFLFFLAAVPVAVAQTAGGPETGKTEQADGKATDTIFVFPRFRHADPAQEKRPEKPSGEVVLLTDQDFAPWSFSSPDGKMLGISVDLALTACEDAGITCKVKALPFADLLSALRRGEGDLIVSGLRADTGIAAETAITRPYFVSMGRFIARTSTTVTSPDVRNLAGRRLGFVKGTSHGAFLETHFPRSSLTPFSTTDEMLDAVRTGAVDAVFGDGVTFVYWLSGEKAKGCCVPLGRAFVDRKLFSRNLVFLTKRDERNLQAVFDFSLDRLESKGVTGRIFTRYLPGPVW